MLDLKHYWEYSKKNATPWLLVGKQTKTIGEEKLQ